MMPAESPNATNDRERVYSISELNKLGKVTLESRFSGIWVEGEISNLKRPQSGHLYFKLKDEFGQINAVLFRGNQSGLKFHPADGIKVRAQGTVSIYVASGSYQIICTQLKEAGKGSLQQQFEELKKRLGDEGLFEKERKMRLPLLPRHVGIVTSATGAAIRDIINVSRRRFPNMHILIAPVMVQGEDAARQIAHAIDYLNQRGGIDVMIIGRGGGSIEDLWAFNEEVVARAIARSKIPIISAVGHETDFTISDFVADMRAPTPSAAAELIVGQKEHFEQRIKRNAARISQSLSNRHLALRNRFAVAAGSYVFREPKNLVRIHRQRLEGLRDSMRRLALASLREAQQGIDERALRSRNLLDRRVETARALIARYASQLRALDPSRVLGRGYSITRNAKGDILRSVAATAIDEVISTQLSDGSLESVVMQREINNDGQENNE